MLVQESNWNYSIEYVKKDNFMYKKLIVLTASICLLSCDNKTTVDKNTEMTIKWIENNKKPIQVETFIYDKSNRNYTLISADNKICATGTVKLELPLIIEDGGSDKKYRQIIKEQQRIERLDSEYDDLQYKIMEYVNK